MSRPIEDLLSDYVSYYSTHRKIGHTNAAITGIKWQDNTRMVFATARHQHELHATRGVRGIRYDDTATLRGTNTPLVWDNAALVEVFAQSLIRIEDLKTELHQAKLGIEPRRLPLWRRFRRWLSNL